MEPGQDRRSAGYIRFVCFILLVCAGSAAVFWGWHNRQLNGLADRLGKARSGLTSNSDSPELLRAYDRIVDVHSTAVRGQQAPFFSDRYSTIAANCTELLRESPSHVSDWIQTHRAAAWRSIGAELKVNDVISNRDLIQVIDSLRQTCRAGLDAQDAIAEACSRMGVPNADISGVAKIAAEVRVTAQHAHGLADVGRKMAAIQRQAREAIQTGLRTAESANQEVGRFESVSDIVEIAKLWEKALAVTESSLSVLDALPSFSDSYQNDAARALAEGDRRNVNRIVSQMLPHLSSVNRALEKAIYEERTLGGRLKRSFGRLAKNAASSRMGREVTMSLKGLVLGTKAFYDLMDMDSRTDLVRWAGRYDDDLDQLMDEAREIRRMDGWSVTGKNTFVETLTDRAYEESFGQQQGRRKPQP